VLDQVQLSFSRPSRLVLLALLTAACGCGQQHTPPEPHHHTRESAATGAELGLPERLNQFPSISASGSQVAVAWASADAAGVTDVYVATSADGGLTFRSPVRVNHTPGDARANGEQPPRVVLVPQSSGIPHILAFWLSRRPSGSVLLTSISRDGGRTFADATLVEGTDTTGNRGWHTLGVDRDGAMSLAWLDHRRLVSTSAASGTHSHHTHGSQTPQAPSADVVDTVAMAQQSDLYFAGGAGHVAPRALTSGVCYCCKTAMVHRPDGTIHIAWRHVYPGNMRDIAMVTSTDGGRTFSDPVRVSEDQWSIAGCPDDGPAMTVDTKGRVHIVWPTVVTSSDGTTQKTLFHSMTADGKTFTPRVAIPHDAAAHHPQIAATAEGAIVVAWDGHIGDDSHVFRARGMVDEAGTMRFTPVGTATAGRYPVVASTDAGSVFAWIAPGEPGTSSIRVATSDSGEPLTATQNPDDED
jgi:pterin-4a-carbinolamine dehydratase